MVYVIVRCFGILYKILYRTVEADFENFIFLISEHGFSLISECCFEWFSSIFDDFVSEVNFYLNPSKKIKKIKKLEIRLDSSINNLVKNPETASGFVYCPRHRLNLKKKYLIINQDLVDFGAKSLIFNGLAPKWSRIWKTLWYFFIRCSRYLLWYR